MAKTYAILQSSLTWIMVKQLWLTNYYIKQEHSLHQHIAERVMDSNDIEKNVELRFC